MRATWWLALVVLAGPSISLAETPGLPATRIAGEPKQSPRTAEEGIQRKAKSVTASSSLPKWKDYTFGPENLFDNDVTTSWQPKTKGGGAGEWVQLDFGAEWTITGVDVANGLQRHDTLGNLFYKNNRITKARLEFSDRTRIFLSLDDRYFGYLHFDIPPKRTRSLRLVVEAVQKGEQWNDLAVSELLVHGRQAAQPGDIPEQPGAPIVSAPEDERTQDSRRTP